MIIYISKKIHDFSEKHIFIEFFKYVSCFLAKVFIRTHLQLATLLRVGWLSISSVSGCLMRNSAMFLQLLHLFNYFRVGLTPSAHFTSHCLPSFRSRQLAHYVQFTLLFYFCWCCSARCFCCCANI